jgi:hypothetical protein
MAWDDVGPLRYLSARSSVPAAELPVAAKLPEVPRVYAIGAECPISKEVSLGARCHTATAVRVSLGLSRADYLPNTDKPPDLVIPADIAARPRDGRNITGGADDTLVYKVGMRKPNFAHL